MDGISKLYLNKSVSITRAVIIKNIEATTGTEKTTLLLIIFILQGCKRRRSRVHARSRARQPP